jgi:acylphosphatase
MYKVEVEMAAIELLAIVKGRVQGVGFRATCKCIAQRLELAGFVHNLADGSVEICAQGSKSQLEKFLSRLREEFPSSCIATDFRFPTKKYSGFEIIRLF